MNIETERLILRPFLETEAGDVFEYLHKPDGTPKYENTYQYALLMLRRKRYSLMQII
jgi:hypothetical protein